VFKTKSGQKQMKIFYQVWVRNKPTLMATMIE